MSAAEIIPFDFEEQAVRVIVRDGAPWFVAADVCRVLGIKNPSQAVARLDEDEKDTIDYADISGMTLCQTEGQSGMTLGQTEGQKRRGGARTLIIISQAAVLWISARSDKPEAQRFWKWVIKVVLPAIFKKGYYVHPGAEARFAAEMGAEIGGDALAIAAAMTPRDWLAMIREARILGGMPAGRKMWDRSPLPPLNPSTPGLRPIDPEEGRAALSHLLERLGGAIGAARGGMVDAIDDLTKAGMRVRRDGLFVANFALSVFAGTRWGGGAHRSAIRALPGVFAAPASTCIGNVSTRGTILPWALIDGEDA